MESIVSTLSEIEQTAISIITHTEVAKKEYEDEIQQKKRTFDEDLAQKTQLELSQIKQTMEVNLDHELAALCEKSEKTIQAIKDEYENQNATYATQIFNRIIGV